MVPDFLCHGSPTFLEVQWRTGWRSSGHFAAALLLPFFWRRFLLCPACWVVGGRSPISGWHPLVLEVTHFFLFFYRSHHVMFPRPNILTSKENVFIDIFVTPSWPRQSSFRLLVGLCAGEVAPFLESAQQQFAIHNSMNSGLVPLTILTVKLCMLFRFITSHIYWVGQFWCIFLCCSHLLVNLFQSYHYDSIFFKSLFQLLLNFLPKVIYGWWQFKSAVEFPCRMRSSRSAKLWLSVHARAIKAKNYVL